MTISQQIFKNGVAVITGAGSGIGEGLARHAHELGMKVVLADIAAARIEAIAAEFRAAGGHALAVATDVSNPAALDHLATVTRDTFGDVQLLVNNAGIETLGYTWEIPAAAWEKTLEINIHGVVHGVRAFAPAMIASAKPCYIANLSSIGGLGMMPIQTSYIMSKHAVLAFSECLYLEMQLKKSLVQVSAVLPGPVATRIFTDADGGGDPLVAHHREMMRGMLEQMGITPQEAAVRIFEQIAGGSFWVSTHPEMTQQAAQARALHLSGLELPQISAQASALLKAD
jgi:NADP-dependent 3-hydroxy acid dehydrogenase YdfG